LFFAPDTLHHVLHVAIAIGGAAGALARHGLGVVVAVSLAPALFPWGTLAVNACGSALLGVLVSVLPPPGAAPALRAGLTVGFCGGFTTFSTFAYEAVSLARAGHAVAAGAYMTSSLVVGLAALAAGMALGTAVARRPHA
jgi:fluoride exporter